MTLEPQFASPRFRSHLRQLGADSLVVDAIIERMNALNTAIAEDQTYLGPGFRIGHSFFTLPDGVDSLDRDWFRRVVRTEIRPLLDEYWFDDPQKAEEWAARLLDGI